MFADHIIHTNRIEKMRELHLSCLDVFQRLRVGATHHFEGFFNYIYFRQLIKRGFHTFAPPKPSVIR